MPFEEDIPEERRLQALEKIVANKRRAIRIRSIIAIVVGLLVVAAHIAFIVAANLPLLSVFKSIIFALAVLAMLGGIWGLYEATRVSVKDYELSAEVVTFIRDGAFIVPYFTYIIVICLVAIYVVQLSVGIKESTEFAGLQKQLVWENGQYWRLLTGSMLHISILHIALNGWVLYSFGGMVEDLSNRAHLATVFLLSMLGGAVMSLLIMPGTNTVGAAGGIMGLAGYLAVFAYRRKHQMPAGFLKSMLVTVGFNVVFGIIAYQIVDNTAFFGGLLIGSAYGLLQVPSDQHANPRVAGPVTSILGYASLVIIVDAAILSILLIKSVVTL